MRPMQWVVGLDEVGRGAWAGPLVAGAVVLGPHFPPNLSAQLTDSKLLSKPLRQELATLITANSAAHGLGWVAPAEVDFLGLTHAVRLAMKRALRAIKIPIEQIVIDGNFNFLADDTRSVAIIKADQTVGAVSAASIIAKVARDDYMAQLEERLPGYGFESHVGYGTLQHRQALATLGASQQHRMTYKPLRALLS